MRNFSASGEVQKLSDHIAIVLSGLCLLHCLLAPLFIVVFPVLFTTNIASEKFHTFLLWLIVPISLLALFLGCLRHKDKLLLTLGLAGLSQLVIMAFWGHQFFSELGEGLLTSAGSITLISGHIRNRQLCCHKAYEN